MGVRAVPLLQQVKSLFQSHPGTSIKLVEALTKNLSNPAALNDAVRFILSLLGSENNAKKKVVYVKMLQGSVSSLKEIADIAIRNELSEKIIAGVASGLAKFTEA